MNNIKTLLLLLFACTTYLLTNAQEVFFEKDTTKLKSIMPSHFYPMQSGNIFREYINKISSDNLRLISAQPVDVADRFGSGAEALGMDISNGYVRTPDAQFYELFQNKVVNMSFWVRFSDDVYSGNKRGILFSVRGKVNTSRKMYCVLENKKVVIYAVRKNIYGQEVEAPIIDMDIPVDMTGGARQELNNYFFFCITAENTTRGKFTRIYISRPDGSLHSRLYYVYPFENVSPTDDMFALWGGWPGNDSPAERMDDLMFFQKNAYSTRTLTPEEVLNNFYLQSPLYEGISYEISSNGNSRGYWGLESQRNRFQNMTEEYVILGGNASQGPFGYNRFIVFKHPSSIRTFKFRNVKMGGRFYPSHNDYVYMELDETNEYYYKYLRESTPESMYTVSPNMFHMSRISDSKYLQSYRYSDKDWLVTDSHPSDRNRLVFGISAASKVFRGAERQHNGMVRLSNRFRGRLDYVTGVIESSINFNRGGEQRFNKSNNKLITTEGNEVGYKSDNAGEQAYYYSNRGRASLTYYYVKDDVNGKPLYIIKANTERGDYTLGGFYQQVLCHEYSAVLNEDGSVPDRYLWSIQKAD